MNKPNYTPGPWFKDGPFVRHVDSGHVIVIVDDALTTEDERSANARLIAAAPEMLEIVKAYRNLLRTSAQTDGQVATYQHVQDVLAKATGGAE